MNTNILTKEEMNNLVGGEKTLEELIAIALELTPEGGSSTWVNAGGGCWDVWRSDLPISSPWHWCF